MNDDSHTSFAFGYLKDARMDLSDFIREVSKTGLSNSEFSYIHDAIAHAGRSIGHVERMLQIYLRLEEE